jgi:hypothetical protein
LLKALGKNPISVHTKFPVEFFISLKVTTPSRFHFYRPTSNVFTWKSNFLLLRPRNKISRIGTLTLLPSQFIGPQTIFSIPLKNFGEELKGLYKRKKEKRKLRDEREMEREKFSRDFLLFNFASVRTLINVFCNLIFSLHAFKCIEQEIKYIYLH